jgi:hypothetical protein
VVRCSVRRRMALRIDRAETEDQLTKDRLKCDLPHDRPRVAAVRVEIKSTRAGRPGHPMVRSAALCAAHARQLRDIGLELVEG